MLGISRSRFCKLSRGAHFPRPHFLSTKRRKLWLMSDLLVYIKHGDEMTEHDFIRMLHTEAARGNF